MSDEPMTVAAGPAAQWDSMGAQLRAKLEELSGPYQRRACDFCGQAVVVGREACLMLDAGRANSIICTDCLAELLRNVEDTLQ